MPSLVSFWRQVLVGTRADETEARLRSTDGSFRWFLFHAAPLFDEQGAVAQWCGTNTDIDGWKRAEQQRKRLFNLVSNVPAIVWEASLDADSGRPLVDHVGPNVERLLGFSPGELEGSPASFLGALAKRIVSERHRS